MPKISSETGCDEEVQDEWLGAPWNMMSTDFIGLDLMIFLITILLRYLLPAIPLSPHQMRTFLCVASYPTLRVTIL